MTTISAARTPRFEFTYLPRQIGLAAALKHTPYSPFRWEALIVLGPFVAVLGLGRNRGWRA